MTGQQLERLTKLQPQLTRVAYAIHHNHYPYQAPDDILQEMNLHIVERVRENPSHFDTNTNKYVINGAAWSARTWCRKQSTRARHQVALDDLDWTLGDDAPNTELSIDVTNALSTLDDDGQRVAASLAEGLRGADLYQVTGLNAQQITRRRRQIRRVLTNALAA